MKKLITATLGALLLLMCASCELPDYAADVAGIYIVTSVIIDGTEVELPGRCTFNALKGETVIINTPGGGGWGTRNLSTPDSSTDSLARTREQS